MSLEEFRSYCKKFQNPIKRLSFGEIDHDIYINKFALSWNTHFPDLEVTDLYKEVCLFNKAKKMEIGELSCIDLVVFNHNDIYLIEVKRAPSLSKLRYGKMKRQLKKQYDFVLDNFDLPAYRIGVYGKPNNFKKIIIPPYLEDIISS